ncbi:putative reverse transcriptase domain-containing protein [Tanacetum coccineum]
MRQRCWIELFSDYDCEIRYHPGKANVVADALRLQRVIDEIIKLRNDGALYYLDRIWVLLKGDVRTLIMDEAHKSKYYVHPGVDKMYYNLRDKYWWLGMKKDIDQLEILEWKWEGIAMDFVTKLPRTSSGYDTIGVIVDRLTKSAYFLHMLEDYKIDRLASYADKRRKHLEFSVGDYVLLKVSPWKGVVRFGKKGKLAPRFVGPFEIIEKPMEILERESKKLKRSRIAIVKVWWNSKRGPEFTWEHEDQMKLKWSIGTRCQGYIGDTFGYHAKDLDVICFGKSSNEELRGTMRISSICDAHYSPSTGTFLLTRSRRGEEDVRGHVTICRRKKTIMIMSHLMMMTMMMMLRRMRKNEEEEEAPSSDLPFSYCYLQMIMSPQAENTEAFETDKSASTPPTSPYHIILSFETKSRAVRMSI